MDALSHILATTGGRGSQFSNAGMEVLSAIVHFLGVSVLSYLLAMKVDLSSLATFQLSRYSIPRVLVILNVLDSWAFIFTTGILVHGTGMELNETVCLLGIVNCIVFYASSKMLIYIFLVEKVHVVWGGRKGRLHSKVYLACLLLLIIYVGVATFLVVGRIAYFRSGDGACVIGLTRASSLTLLIYDLAVNLILTSLFVWPLLDRQFTASIRRVAIRTLWAAAIALTTSCVNILVLTIMHGQQLAWVCLASCGTDVVVNAAVLCWVTGSKSEQLSEHSHEPSGPDSKNPTAPPNIVLYGDFGGSAPSSPGARRSMHARGGSSKLARMFGLGGGAGGGAGAGGYAYGGGGRTRGGGGGEDVELATTGTGADTRSAGSVAALELDRKAAVLGAAPAVSAPRRAHSSTVKRSNHGLSRHGGSVGVTSEVQIVVTREMDILSDSDEIFPSPPRSPDKNAGRPQGSPW